MICIGIDVAKDKHDCFILSSAKFASTERPVRMNGAGSSVEAV